VGGVTNEDCDRRKVVSVTVTSESSFPNAFKSAPRPVKRNSVTRTWRPVNQSQLPNNVIPPTGHAGKPISLSHKGLAVRLHRTNGLPLTANDGDGERRMGDK